jgi:CRISPR-associated protein Cas2
MVVMILERVPTSVRGELTRWFLEPHPGVFVGRCSAAIRDRLWERTCGRLAGGAALLIHHVEGEQGYSLRFWGNTKRKVEDFEGLLLVRT